MNLDHSGGELLSSASLGSASLEGRTPDKAPPCMKCRWFSVTWDAAFPRACKVFGFKGHDLPSLSVFRATGKHCPAFEKSEKIAD